MIQVQVCKAYGRNADTEPDAMYIVAEVPISDDLDAEQSVATFTRDAGLICDALWGSLPGSTLDALIAMLMARRASQLRVTLPAANTPTVDRQAGTPFEPFVDRSGHGVWATTDGLVEWTDPANGDMPGDGWVRLYRPIGGAA